MVITAFDIDKYIRIQSEHIRERIAQFGNKLYLEMGGKLFDDLHASRVLPGFLPDTKLRMLKGCQAHSTVMLKDEDWRIFKKLGIDLTTDPASK